MAEDSIPYGASHDDNGNRVCIPLWLELAIVRVRKWLGGGNRSNYYIVLEFSFMDLLHERVASRCGYWSIWEALFFYLGIKEKESRK